MSEMMLLNPPRGKGKYTEAVKEFRKLGIGPEDLLKLAEAKRADLAKDNKITVKSIEPKGKPTFIKGIVMMHDAKIDPESMNGVTIVKENPILNPMVPDNIFVSAISGLANGSVLTYLTSLIQNSAFEELKKKSVENADLLANGIGFVSCTAMTVLEYAMLNMVESEERENYQKLAVYSGIASMSVPFVNLVKIAYQKISNSVQTPQTQTPQTQTPQTQTPQTQTPQITNTVVSGGVIYDDVEKRYYIVENGEKQYLNDYLTPQKKMQLEMARRGQQRLSGMPFASSKKLPWQ